MEKSLKLFYYVITSIHTWGRGETLDGAFKNARLTTSVSRRKHEAFVYTLVFKSDTSQEIMEQIVSCWVVSPFGALVKADDVTQADNDLIKQYVIGWARTIHFKKGKESFV